MNLTETASYPVTHAELNSWIAEITALCTPEHVYWCDGSVAEYSELCELLVSKGTFLRLNPEKRPGSFAAFSDPGDVARLEDRTFICSRKKEDAGPTNNWVDPKQMKANLQPLLEGCM